MTIMQRWDDVSGESDDFDDPVEPIMEGSNDEFSDLEDVGRCDADNDLLDGASPSEDPTAPPDDDIFYSSTGMDPDPGSDMDMSAADYEPQCTTTLKHNTINYFSSPVGPAVAILKLPLELFFFFTPELLDVIVKETIMLNR